MKLFIGTQEEPFYLPLFFQRLFERIPGHEVVGVNILPPFNSQDSWWQVLRDYYGLFGPTEFCRQGLLFTWHKAADVCRLEVMDGRPHSVKRVMRRHGIPVHRVRRQNTKAFRRLLDCDIFVSVANPVVLKARTLRRPRHGGINFHAGYLPRYRGINPSFWALLHGEKESAVTVHRMDEKLDSGPILGQRVIPLTDSETLHGLFLRVVELGPTLLADVLDGLEAGSVAERPNSDAESSYFGFPKPEDGKLFRERGRRFR